MKIAISMDNQFGQMTGIQHYADNLLGALYALDTPHELTAFAPGVLTVKKLQDAAQDNLFRWLDSPRARVDLGGNELIRMDNRMTRSLKRRTYARRARWASRRYDVLHLPDINELDLWPRRTVATIHDVICLRRPEWFEPRIVAQWGGYFRGLAARCARILTDSEWSKQDIMELLGVPADRVDVTPLAARAATAYAPDSEERRAALRRFGLTGVPFVLYAGTLEPRKNLMRLVEAFAQVVKAEKMPEHRLVLAGGKWKDHDREILDYAASLRLAGQVITTGYVSNAEMNALMSSCAAFAYVSEYEGFGLPPLEAMVCGAPVVSSNTSSLPEVVGEAGIQVTPTDVGAIAEALHLLLTDEGENSRRRTLSLARAGEFSWERTARLTLQSYEAANA